MRVLIDTSPLNSGHAIRGIGTYTRELVEHLEQLDEVEIVRSTILGEGEKAKADITHYPFFDLFFNTLPMAFSRPTVVTIHDVIPLKFPEQYPPGVKGKIRFEKQKMALRTANGIITDSNASKQDIEKLLGISEDKIHVVYLAANPDLKAQKEAVIKRVKKTYDLPNKYVLYVGDINYNKNIPQLIKMVKYLSDDIHLVCLGKNFVEQDIPEWNWIETQLALSNVTDRVKFITNVLTDSDDDLAAIYSGAQCYVQPSLYEGFGLPVLEAMQCRTPVVSTKVSSLVEVAGDHAVYTGPEAAELAKGVEEVLSWTKTKRAEKIRAAYKWSQIFSWKKTAKDTFSVYKNILNQK